MPIIVFILLGLAACGFTRGRFNSTVAGVMLDLCLGAAGAVIAGSLFNQIATADVPGLVIASGLAAIAGAAALLAAYHAAFSGRRGP